LRSAYRDVKRWFVENDLLVNADKSEVMMIGTPAQLRAAASTANTVAASFDTFCLVAPQPQEIEKEVQLAYT